MGEGSTPCQTLCLRRLPTNRALALDVYAAAKLIEDPHNRRIMERVALGYENLAARAEARVRTAELVASLTPDDKPA